MKLFFRLSCIVAFLLLFIIICPLVSFLGTCLLGESLLKDRFLVASDFTTQAESSVPGPDWAYNGSDSAQSANFGLERIPRLIHQTYRTAAVPKQWTDAQASCQHWHKANWTYKFWTNEDSEKFIAAHYPWFLSCFLSYPYDIQRADAVRYFALYHFGGFYLDLDVGCKKPLSPFLRFDAVLPKTDPIGVSNDVMGATRHHPFFWEVMRALPSSNRKWGTKYPTVFFSTGPMLLNYQLSKFMREGPHWRPDPMARTMKPQNAEAKPDVRIIPPQFYGAGEDSFFLHYAGSSWHGNDVRLLRLIWVKRYQILFLSGLSIIAAFMLQRWRRHWRGFMTIARFD